MPEPSPSTVHVLAIDLGTGGPKVAVVSHAGEIVASASDKVPLHLLPDGGAEQEPEDWWRAISAAARRTLADAATKGVDRLAGVGCTAQWSGTVATDSDGRPLRPAIIWMDSRGNALVRRQVRGSLPVMGYDARKVARWVRRTGGAPALSGKDPVGHILWLRQHEPEVYRATHKFLEPVDWLNHRLTGRFAASFDSITLHWVTDNRRIGAVSYDEELLAQAGLERNLLPDLVPTATVVGELQPAAAADLGLEPGLPVVTGTGDLHSAAVGSGAVEDFAAHLYIGTSSWLSCHVPYKKTALTTNIASIPAGLPGRYLVADEHETAGACLTFLLEELLYPDDELARAAGPSVAGVPVGSLALLDGVAASVPPGAGGVLFTPWLNGERSPVEDHTIRGGFHNLSLGSTRRQMVRAAYEGVALNSRWLLGAVEKFVGRRIDSIALIGGGANSDVWCQIHADAMDRTIRQIADPVLANVRGAGMLTLLALGHVKVADMPKMVSTRATFEPDARQRALYDDRAAEFVNLYKQTKDIHKRLNRF